MVLRTMERALLPKSLEVEESMGYGLKATLVVFISTACPYNLYCAIQPCVNTCNVLGQKFSDSQFNQLSVDSI